MFDNQEIEQFIGQSFGGYRVTRFIASGRTGAVFAGVQEESPENAVAIKLLDPSLTDETFNERFEQAALGVAGLSHPNIVQVRDFGSDGPLHFIVTDLIEGESLRDQLVAAHAEGSSLTAETITSIAQQVGGALFFAHRSGYIHGDIKPENILVTQDGWVHVSDFGLVRTIGEHQTTSNGVSAGTPEYLSPEQAQGVTPITPLADLYSLGIVTYEMTVGRVPFQARSAATVIRMQEHAAPPLPSSLLPGFPPEIESVLMRTLEKDPASRFESVDTFLRSLLAAMGPTKQVAATAAGEAAIVPEQPAEAEPAPPPAEIPEPESPALLDPPRPMHVIGAAPRSRFEAVRSHQAVLTGGAFALVLAALLVFIPAVWGSAGPSTRLEKTTATSGVAASPAPSTAPAATPPPVQAAVVQPPPPPPASTAPVTIATPPPPPPSAEPVESSAAPIPAEAAQPPPPPSAAPQVTAAPPSPSPRPRWQPPTPPLMPSPPEVAKQFLHDFFTDQPPANPPAAGPDDQPYHRQWRHRQADGDPADSGPLEPPPPPSQRQMQQSERDFLRNFFNNP